MKNCLLLALLACLCLEVKAQSEVDSIKKYLQLERDKFTDKSNVVPIVKLEDKTSDGYAFTMLPCYNVDGNFIAISFSCKDIGCVKEKDEINYLFEDNSKSLGYHFLSFNCQGLFTSVYKSWVAIEPVKLEKFTSVPLSMIRLITIRKSTEIHLTKQQAILLMNQIKWIKYYWDNKKKLTKANLFASN
jgi:hypothetical protein